jgi:hypothetical protein
MSEIQAKESATTGMEENYCKMHDLLGTILLTTDILTVGLSVGLSVGFCVTP